MNTRRSKGDSERGRYYRGPGLGAWTLLTAPGHTTTSKDATIYRGSWPYYYERGRYYRGSWPYYQEQGSEQDSMFSPSDTFRVFICGRMRGVNAIISTNSIR